MTGFSPATLDFLRGLERNNDREWFTGQRAACERHLYGPMKALVAELAPAMSSIEPAFEVRPAGGRTISRLNRDTRFSRDKRPYRSSCWCVFRRPGPEWADAPAFFFEVAPDAWRYGMGFYAASPSTMAGVRRRILAREGDFAAALAAAEAAGLATAGEPYRRPPPEAAGRGGPAGTWLRLRSAYVARTLAPEDGLFAPDLARAVEHAFAAATLLYRLLAIAAGQRQPKV